MSAGKGKCWEVAICVVWNLEDPREGDSGFEQNHRKLLKVFFNFYFVYQETSNVVELHSLFFLV